MARTETCMPMPMPMPMPVPVSVSVSCKENRFCLQKSGRLCVYSAPAIVPSCPLRESPFRRRNGHLTGSPDLCFSSASCNGNAWRRHPLFIKGRVFILTAGHPWNVRHEDVMKPRIKPVLKTERFSSAHGIFILIAEGWDTRFDERHRYQPFSG